MLRGKMANGKNAKKATTTNQTNYFAHMRKNQKAKKKIAKKAQRQLKIDNIRKTTTKQQKQLCAKNLNFANVLGNETKQQKQREDGPQFGKKIAKRLKKASKTTKHHPSNVSIRKRRKSKGKQKINVFFAKRPPESKMSELANKRTLQLDFEIRNWQIKTKTKNSKII